MSGGRAFSIGVEVVPMTNPASGRWRVVAGALLIQVALGAIYAWSVFTPSLRDDFGFTATQTQAVFAVGLASFALSMVFAGRWLAKAGPQRVAITGGALLGIGYILARWAGASAEPFWGLMATIGVLGGAGIGLAYVCPIAAGIQWFPDKKGRITGLAVAGFGFGALLWVKLAGDWGGLIAAHGVLDVFALYGVAFLALTLAGGLLLTFPPPGWKPDGWTPPEPGTAGASGLELDPRAMLGTHQFYALWLMFTASAMAGLMVIGNIALFGRAELVSRGGYAPAEALAIAGTAMAVFYSLANGIGRIAWGAISDRIGCRSALVAMTVTQGLMLLVLVFTARHEWLFYAGAAVVGFNFGGNFALFPTATADFFGTRHVGRNYPYVFLAYGVGGITGPILGGLFEGRYGTAFALAGVACLAAAALAVVTRAPHTKPAPAPATQANHA